MLWGVSKGVLTPSGGKKKAKRKPTEESQQRYLRGNKGVVTSEDGLPAMQRCLYLAVLSILADLEAHEKGELQIPLRERVGIFSQFAEKVRLFEGKNPDGSDQVTALVAETLKLLNRNAETDG
jgi:hypothetical protein